MAAERDEVGHRWHEVELSFGAIKIERGDLPAAQEHVRRAGETAAVASGDLRARALMYEGEISMLRGEYAHAESCLRRSCRMFDKARATTNHRGGSLAYRRLGDLHAAFGRNSKASSSYLRSLALAESGRHFDLAFFTRVREALLQVTSREPHELDEARVRGELDEALRFATVCGIARLEFEAHQARAELSLVTGNWDAASEEVHQCLAIAAGSGLSLRVTGALVLLARVRARQGDIDTSRRLLESARMRAQHQRCQQDLRTIESALVHL